MKMAFPLTTKRETAAPAMGGGFCDFTQPDDWTSHAYHIQVPGV